jgi:uncharacterized protein YpmB
MNPLARVFRFYYDGFKNMNVGKTLWLIILIKVIVIFCVLRIFFFKPALRNYKTPEAKAEKVIENLTAPRN